MVQIWLLMLFRFIEFVANVSDFDNFDSLQELLKENLTKNLLNLSKRETLFSFDFRLVFLI